MIKKIENKKIFIFDLDKTLTRSKSNLTKETATLLRDVLKKFYVAVISGGAWKQFKKQLIDMMPKDTNWQNLLISTTSGSSLYENTLNKKDKWGVAYSKDLTKETRKDIIKAIKKAIVLSGVDMPKKTYGPRFEDRISQITMSALGQKAHVNLKEKWDPDAQKKLKIVSILRPMLPNLHVASGGSTSIDVTQKGVNKAFGVREILKTLNLEIKDAVYIGDALYRGGNDFIVKETGIDTIPVKDYLETRKILKLIKKINE